MLFLELFITFFQIGLFGFGGGYAMLSMIQGEVVTGHHWISSSEFTDIVAISQMTPGPIGINSATYVGYTAVVNAGYSHVWGIAGSITATFAVVLPSFILMIAISKFFLKYQKHPLVESVFKGLRPAVVGLLASAALLLMTAENFGSYQTDTYQWCISILIFLIAFIGTRKFKVSPILMIVLCGLAGWILYQ
ncbi:MAG: chromate transporter [Bacteroides sp.]|nr:chromate transporter [Bacteroides sp.]